MDIPDKVLKAFDRLKEDEDGVRLWAFVRGGSPVVSDMTLAEKRDRAISLGVPTPGSGIPGEWQDDHAKRVVLVPFTDESLDTYNTAFDSDGWDFRRYNENPAVFFSHASDDMPVGMTLRIDETNIKGKDEVVRKGFLAHVLFSPEELNPRAETAYKNWMAGRLRGASVGFRPTKVEPATDEDRKAMTLPEDEEAWIIREAELLELSIVPVPSNASAVARNADALRLVAEGVEQSEARHILGVDESDDTWRITFAKPLDEDEKLTAEGGDAGNFSDTPGGESGLPIAISPIPFGGGGGPTPAPPAPLSAEPLSRIEDTVEQTVAILDSLRDEVAVCRRLLGSLNDRRESQPPTNSHTSGPECSSEWVTAVLDLSHKFKNRAANDGKSPERTGE
jgi:HK97 family phage prohead protease